MENDSSNKKRTPYVPHHKRDEGSRKKGKIFLVVILGILLVWIGISNGWFSSEKIDVPQTKQVDSLSASPPPSSVTPPPPTEPPPDGD